MYLNKIIEHILKNGWKQSECHDRTTKYQTIVDLFFR